MPRSKPAATPFSTSAGATLVLMVEYDLHAAESGEARAAIDELLSTARQYPYARVTKAFVQYAPTEARIVTLVGDAEP